MALAKGCFWLLPKLGDSVEPLHSEEQWTLERNYFSVIRLSSWWAKHHLTTHLWFWKELYPGKKGVCVELQAGLQSGSLCYKASTSLGMWSRNFCRRFMWITHCLMLRVRQLRHTVLNILAHMNFNHYLLGFKRKKINKNDINTDLMLRFFTRRTAVYTSLPHICERAQLIRTAEGCRKQN